MKILSNTHNLLIVRRLLPPPILLILCCFAACSEDSPVALEPALVKTRTAADSTAVSDSIVVPPIQVDTVWADTLYYDFEGQPANPSFSLSIDSVETSNAAEAV